jgi:hypothetical protein
MIVAEIITNTILFITIWRFDWYAYTKEVTERLAADTTVRLLDNESSVDTATSSLGASESLPLLSPKNDQDTNAKSTIQDVSPLQSVESPVKKGAKSLWKLIGVKIIILIPLICLLIVSIVFIYK